jgi:hypothetical protein
LPALRAGEGFSGLGYGFFFVPINIIAYSQLRPDQNNRASSLTNFFRNWGGSFGIALITTVAERRQQFHRRMSARQLLQRSSSSPHARMLSRITWSARAFTRSDAALAAQGGLFQQLQHQVSLVAFMDTLRILAWLTLATIPLLFAIRHFKPVGALSSIAIPTLVIARIDQHFPAKHPYCLDSYDVQRGLLPDGVCFPISAGGTEFPISPKSRCVCAALSSVIAAPLITPKRF